MWKILPLVFLLSACSAVMKSTPERYQSTPSVQENPMAYELRDVPALDGPAMTIGVYSFTDKTGQRAPSVTGANLSSAVTQGAEVWVIDALLEAGGGKWFEVVERVGMDNVVKERQLIRSTRENYERDNATPLKPLKFAGVILEGGIVGYDSNTTTGGQHFQAKLIAEGQLAFCYNLDKNNNVTDRTSKIEGSWKVFLRNLRSSGRLKQNTTKKQ